MFHWLPVFVKQKQKYEGLHFETISQPFLHHLDNAHFLFKVTLPKYYHLKYLFS